MSLQDHEENKRLAETIASLNSSHELDKVVQEIIADVLCDTQGIQPRSIEHTRMVVSNRIEAWAAQHIEQVKREARLDEQRNHTPECWHYNNVTEAQWMEIYFKLRSERIAELEKQP